MSKLLMHPFDVLFAHHPQVSYLRITKVDSGLAIQNVRGSHHILSQSVKQIEDQEGS